MSRCVVFTTVAATEKGPDQRGLLQNGSDG
jgi:hypothetical protein